MKTRLIQTLAAAFLLCARALFAGDYASDVASVGEAQAQALEQAKQMLAQTEKPDAREALKKAIEQMEHAELMLADAKKAPEKLNAAVTAEESAYQGLLKIIPHDFQISRSKSKGRSGGRAGQPRGGQIDQLELANDDNRYENERQATAAQTPKQKEQLQIADRLKQLAQRQQDLNDRLKELQTALAEAKTDQEKEEIKRQLKRLSDEERQALADVDELRQSMDQSPNASSLSNARQQLDQARNDTQRASQELQNESVSQALAAGARAQQRMQELRENLKSQASSQFARQMRDLRTEARDLASKEEKIGSTLDSLSNSEHKALDDSAQRQQLVQQMEKQQSAFTNLLGGMQSVSEQAESSEPLLSEQLYDTLRRASQMHNENLLQTGEQLIDHGLVSQAGEAESNVRKNFNELREKVERAAQSVLGNEAEALRYAQKELDDLSAKVEREAAGGGTNSSNAKREIAGGGTNSTNASREIAGAGTNSTRRVGSMSGPQGTNSMAAARPGNGNGQSASQSSGRPGTERGTAPGESTRGENPSTGNDPSRGSQQASNQNSGQPESERGTTPGESANGGNPADGNQPGGSGQQQSSENPGKSSSERGSTPGQAGGGDGSTADNQPSGGDAQPSNSNSNSGSGQADGGSANGSAGGDRERLRDIARQFGGATTAGGGRGGLGINGPITGNDFVNWTDRMRDVEQVVDSTELRNRLAEVRERVAAFRSDFRRRGEKPDPEKLRQQVLDPMTEVRARLQEDLARLANANSLVPLDHDPVPENYSEMVRKYYEKLGGGQ